MDAGNWCPTKSCSACWKSGSRNRMRSRFHPRRLSAQSRAMRGAGRSARAHRPAARCRHRNRMCPTVRFSSAAKSASRRNTAPTTIRDRAQAAGSLRAQTAPVAKHFGESASSSLSTASATCRRCSSASSPYCRARGLLSRWACRPGGARRRPAARTLDVQTCCAADCATSVLLRPARRTCPTRRAADRASAVGALLQLAIAYAWHSAAASLGAGIVRAGGQLGDCCTCIAALARLRQSFRADGDWRCCVARLLFTLLSCRSAVVGDHAADAGPGMSPLQQLLGCWSRLPFALWKVDRRRAHPAAAAGDSRSWRRARAVAIGSRRSAVGAAIVAAGPGLVLNPMKLHILGICGTFMGGVAALARELGHEVEGSDANVYPPMSDQLRALGIALKSGYAAAASAAGAGSGRGRQRAVARQPGDRIHAGRAHCPTSPVRNGWAKTCSRSARVLAVAGTHGKTTTTSLLAHLLDADGRNPGFLVGGVPENFGVSARLGDTRAPFRHRGRRIRHRVLRQALEVRALPADDRDPQQSRIRSRRHFSRRRRDPAPVPSPGAHGAGQRPADRQRGRRASGGSAGDGRAGRR